MGTIVARYMRDSETVAGLGLAGSDDHRVRSRLCNPTTWPMCQSRAVSVHFKAYLRKDEVQYTP